MGMISAELTNFYDDANGKTEAMSSTSNDIVNKLQKISSTSISAKSSISSYYDSENKDIVLSSFDVVANICDEIIASVGDTLSPMVTGAQEIVTMVEQLKTMESEIESLTSEVQKRRNDEDSSSMMRFLTQLNIKKNDFNELHRKAKNKLFNIKGMDAPIVIKALEAATGAENEIVVNGGTFTEHSFVSSLGVTVSYYLYVPTVEDKSVKLPILTYFHGMNDTVKRNENNNFKYGGGLAGLIETGQLTPKGLIIFPQAENGTSNQDFYAKPYQEAIIELIKKTASEYNGDLNRVSVAGHSNGGAAVQHIVNNYPGFFAAAAPMGIASNAKEGMAKTNLYAIVGVNDHTMDNYSRAIGFAQKNNQMYKVYNMGHDVQTVAFRDPVEDENGNEVMLVDWLMSKTLA